MTTVSSLYDFYCETTSDELTGLCTEGPYFNLNKKRITILSGALHYFRVPPQYWRNRLRKFRAAGLNCIETYIPWNLHEPEIGNFDFGKGDSDFCQFLDLEKFLKIVQEEDLLAIIRPGPYICAEWEFGGLPSWLLRENVKVRTSDSKFIEFVRQYFKVLLQILSKFQFTKGGPIIAFQIENEYGNTKNGNEPVDTKYLETLKNILEENGIVELLFTSDTPSNGFAGTLSGVLATANFQTDPIKELTLLKQHQPEKPLMVMEYWTGWFDHWAEKHHLISTQTFEQVLEEILKFNSSVNMYMFHGGTNWGFLNGANLKNLTTENSSYQPDTTSYDYDAPLAENGDCTEKYYKVKDLTYKYDKLRLKVPELHFLDTDNRKVFPTVQITDMLTLDDLIQQSLQINSVNLQPMELLNINNNSGQSYGYIVYRQVKLDIPANSVLTIEGNVCDTVLVLINGELKSKIPVSLDDLNDFGFWRQKNSTLNLGENEYKNATLDILVENFGRCNYGKLNQFNQFKGLWQGHVLLNSQVLQNWKIIPLEFKRKWTGGLKNWSTRSLKIGPCIYRSFLDIDEPVDTYIDLRTWTKGFVIINNFVLGRYWNFGPQQTLYLPAPFLQNGRNTLLIFEHFQPKSTISFLKNPIFECIN